MEQAIAIVFGSLYACIAGDHRYASQIKVFYNLELRTVIVTRFENGARGGMDGDGSAFDMTPRYTETLPRICGTVPTGQAIVAAVRRAIDDTIHCYGKPTKSFYWGVNGQSELGMSAAKAAKALGLAEVAANREWYRQNHGRVVGGMTIDGEWYRKNDGRAPMTGPNPKLIPGEAPGAGTVAYYSQAAEQAARKS